MIAKGLDFPNVTLVGVINADTALHLPDFRAAERTFQLVTQVAGRTGRGPKGGRVLVQTFSPDHPAIQAAVRHDYAAFAAGELPMREMLRYPPFAGDDSAGDSRAGRSRSPPSSPSTWPSGCGRRWRPNRPTPGCWGRPRALRPAARQVSLSDSGAGARRRAALRAAVASGHGTASRPKDVQWIADVDPVEML